VIRTLDDPALTIKSTEGHIIIFDGSMLLMSIDKKTKKVGSKVNL